jgi:hypothetical protein
MFPKDPAILLKDLFLKGELGYDMDTILSMTALVLFVLLLIRLSNFIGSVIIRTYVTKIGRLAISVRIDIFRELKMFTRLSHFAPVLVQHRDYTGHGIPVRAYAFTTNTGFITSENIQTEVFGHLFAVMNDFELKVSQPPAGADVLSAEGNKLNN